MTVETTDSAFTSGYTKGQIVNIPVAHHDGNYYCDDETLAALRDQDRIAFTYTENVNGARENIAGVLSENRRVLGMMPHPERAIDANHGGTDGQALFRSILDQLVSA